MVKSEVSCDSIRTKADTRWPYHKYYIGERDQEKRRNGHGQNHWTGAESLESYTGKFICDTMHGLGVYRWRYKGPDGTFVTYEGNFYGNYMHGYGVMSYPDGRVFNGIFHKNMRCGPGIQTHLCLHEDVGLWRGTQLIRLTWRPATPSIALDLTVGPNGKACIEPHRTLLTTSQKTIDAFNNAVELLKQCGAEPVAASEKWTKLYPRHCNDFASELCLKDIFDLKYFKNKILDLEEVACMPAPKEDASHGSDDCPSTKTYFAWNNSEIITSMMKHCFKHEEQRISSGIELLNILTGRRSQYKPAGNHELDCRSILMASYLGRIINVAQLVNENNVHPNVADIQGNTALMYATCGDQADIVHFLAEAGADVNSYNDCCYTPLGMALVRFACERKEIAASGMLQALVPPPVVPPPTPTIEEKASEWHITRDIPTQEDGQLTAAKPTSAKKIKSATSEVMPSSRRKDKMTSKYTALVVTDALEISEDTGLFNNLNTEFVLRVTDLFSLPSGINPIPYIFKVNDMSLEVKASEVEQMKPPEKLAKMSKITKSTINPSKDMMFQSSDRDILSMSSADKARIEMLSQKMSTIKQLLADGADPRLVRCPQPALFIAAVAGCPDLIRLLVKHGADINEVYPQTLNYTVLDVALSQPLTDENLNVIRAILECGAKTNHRLQYEELNKIRASLVGGASEIMGPTLLHAVLAKKTENDTEEEIRRQLLELLLQYHCDPQTQFNGRSATDMAMSMNMDIFDIFVKSPKTDLNAIINQRNENALIKMFSFPFCKTIPVADRVQTLTDLLLFGADPLLECQKEEIRYKNLFVFAKETFTELIITQISNPIVGKGDSKGKKNDKALKESKPLAKSSGRLAIDHVGDYKQAVNLLTECARILHIRWLQAKLLKELIKVVTKFQHRQWNMILPEHKNKKACGLWLTCPRSLEIWDVLKTRRKKSFNDRRILKHALCLVHFYYKRKSSLKHRVTGDEKTIIEIEVGHMLQEHKMAGESTTEKVSWARPYIMPELTRSADEKFQVCFQCSLPFDEEKILCSSCKQISFCSFECLKTNTNRFNCHPCRECLKNKYFGSPDDTTVDVTTVDVTTVDV